MLKFLFKKATKAKPFGVKSLGLVFFLVALILLTVLAAFWFLRGSKPVFPSSNITQSPINPSQEREPILGKTSGGETMPLPERRAIFPNDDYFLVEVTSGKNKGIKNATVLAEKENLKTDEKGYARLQITPKELRVFHPDYSPYCHFLTEEEKKQHRITVLLFRGADLRCRVIGQNGQPLQGALVEVSCGGISMGGKESDWMLSLRRGKDGNPIYCRRLRANKNGECIFHGLSPQPHKVTSRLYGYLDVQDNGIQFGRTIKLKSGFNSLNIVLSQLYAQVVIVQNKTGLPEKVFSHLLYFSGSFPRGGLDIHPSLSEPLNASKEQLKKVVGFKKESSEIYIHCAWSPYANSAFGKEGIVAVQYLYGGKWRFKLKWCPLLKIGPNSVKRIVVSSEFPKKLGRLKVASPYDVGAYPVLEGGKETVLGFGFRSSRPPGIEKELPVGEYILKPSANFLNNIGRSVKVKVLAYKCTEVNLHLKFRPIARLVVLVLDESGSGPAYNVRIIVECLSGRAKGRYLSCRPTKRFYPDGRFTLMCEPGNYRIRICRGNWPPVWRKELDLSAGADVLIRYKLGE